jgi:hypothetical protein
MNVETFKESIILTHPESEAEFTQSFPELFPVIHFVPKI